MWSAAPVESQLLLTREDVKHYRPRASCLGSSWGGDLEEGCRSKVSCAILEKASIERCSQLWFGSRLRGCGSVTWPVNPWQRAAHTEV